MQRTSDLNVNTIEPLITPRALKAALPMSASERMLTGALHARRGDTVPV